MRTAIALTLCCLCSPALAAEPSGLPSPQWDIFAAPPLPAAPVLTSPAPLDWDLFAAEPVPSGLPSPSAKPAPSGLPSPRATVSPSATLPVWDIFAQPAEHHKALGQLRTYSAARPLPLEPINRTRRCQCLTGGTCHCAAAGQLCACYSSILQQGPRFGVWLISSDSCPPCVVAEREAVPYLERSGWPVKVIKREEEPELVAALSVQATPTFLFVRHHKLAGQLVGYPDNSTLRSVATQANRLR